MPKNNNTRRYKTNNWEHRSFVALPDDFSIRELLRKWVKDKYLDANIEPEETSLRRNPIEWEKWRFALLEFMEIRKYRLQDLTYIRMLEFFIDYSAIHVYGSLEAQVLLTRTNDIYKQNGRELFRLSKEIHRLFKNKSWYLKFSLKYNIHVHPSSKTNIAWIDKYDGVYIPAYQDLLGQRIHINKDFLSQ